jgi:TrmH family RNA methyltransferase
MLEVSERIFQGLADTETPQGIAAIVAYPQKKGKDLVYGPATFMVVCDGVRDPGNLGTIIRLADAAGADAVAITPGTCSPFNQKAIRSTAGSLFNVPLLFTPPEELAATLRKNKVSLYIADSHATVSVFETNFKGPFALVFGNEGMGTGEVMKSNADKSIRIPLRGRAESLNVAAAAAICIYEAVRQRIS